MESTGEGDTENHYVMRWLRWIVTAGFFACLLGLSGCKSCPSKAQGADAGAEWQTLLSAKSHAGWRPAENVAGAGEVRFEKPGMVFDFGDPLTMAVYTNALPTVDYEVEIIARKVEGADFFCGFTFPVSTNHCTLILGGWGGFVTGISSLDGLDASENETASSMNFVDGQWYTIRQRVEAARLQTWVDDKQLIDVDLTNRRVEMRAGDIEASKPFGIASYITRAEFRLIRIRKL